MDVTRILHRAIWAVSLLLLLCGSIWYVSTYARAAAVVVEALGAGASQADDVDEAFNAFS